MNRVTYLTLTLAAALLVGGCQGDKAVEMNNKAVDEMARGNLRQAETLLKSAASQQPNSAEVRYNLAELYTRQRDFRSALREMQDAVRLAPGRTEWIVELARTQVNAGQYEDALESLAKARSADTESADYHYLTGRAELGLTRFDKAETALKACLAKDAEHFWGNLATGVLLVSTDRRAMAREYLEKAHDLRPDSVDAAKHLAEFLANEGRYDDAMETLDKGIAQDNTDADLFLLKAQVLIRQRKHNEAVQVLESAVARNAQSLEAHRTLAWVYNQTGALARAKEECDEVLKMNPKDVTALNIRGAVYAKQKRTPLAITDFSDSLAIDPNQPEIKEILALLRPE